MLDESSVKMLSNYKGSRVRGAVIHAQLVLTGKNRVLVLIFRLMKQGLIVKS